LSYVSSGKTRKFLTLDDDSATWQQVFHAISRWNARQERGKCPRCGKKIGKLVQGKWVSKTLHCPKCRKLWLSTIVQEKGWKRRPG
jgi:hypothetical protein